MKLSILRRFKQSGFLIVNQNINVKEIIKMRNTICYIVVLFVGFLGFSCLGQDATTNAGPSLQETIEYLKSSFAELNVQQTIVSENTESNDQGYRSKLHTSWTNYSIEVNGNKVDFTRIGIQHHFFYMPTGDSSMSIERVTEKLEFSLNDLNPEFFSYGKVGEPEGVFQIRFNDTVNKPVTFTRTLLWLEHDRLQGKEKSEHFSQSYFTIRVREEQTARRIANAFKRAVLLSGGKPPKPHPFD